MFTAENRSPARCTLMDMAFNARSTSLRDAGEDVQMRSATCGAAAVSACGCVCVFIVQISRWQCLCKDESPGCCGARGGMAGTGSRITATVFSRPLDGLRFILYVRWTEWHCMI